MNPVIATQNGPVVAPRHKARGQRQNARVLSGVQSGSIDSAELNTLKQLRAEDKAAIAEAKASGGKVGPWERRALHLDLSATSWTIAQYKHNG